MDSPITIIKGWILLTAQHSNQRAVTEQCTNSRRCVRPLHSIHCQPACPSASSRLPSLIQMFLMLARKPKMMKSLPSRGIRRRPILKANNLHKNHRRPRDRREAMDEDSATYADDQHIPPSVTANRAKGQAPGMLMCFCLSLLEFQTHKSIATVRGRPGCLRFE